MAAAFAALNFETTFSSNMTDPASMSFEMRARAAVLGDGQGRCVKLADRAGDLLRRLQADSPEHIGGSLIAFGLIG